MGAKRKPESWPWRFDDAISAPPPTETVEEHNFCIMTPDDCEQRLDGV